MKVVITAATAMELDGIKQRFSVSNQSKHSIEFHTSGVGILTSTFSLSKLIFEEKPGLIIQVGIAGSFDHTIDLASIVAVKSEFMGDTGVLENGEFKDVFDLNLQHANGFPFTNKALVNPHVNEVNYLSLPIVDSVTINEITTNVERIQQLKNKYGATVETMEGAALHYTCLSTQTKFFQIRAISNYIGERDKSKWKIKDALQQLQKHTVAYIDKLNDSKDQ